MEYNRLGWNKCHCIILFDISSGAMVNVGLANDGPNSNADTGKMILLG